MDVVLIALGTRGDINPFVGLGIALQNRGHQCYIISYKNYAQFVQKAGLNYIAFASENYLDDLMRDMYLVHPVQTFTSLMLDPMRPVYDIIKTRFNPEKTLLVGQFPFAVGARLAQEKLSFPLVNICLQPSVLFSSERLPKLSASQFFSNLPHFIKKIILTLAYKYIFRGITSVINEFRKELGLAKVNNIWDQWLPSPERVIGLFPSWFASIPSDWPTQVRTTGFINYTGNPQEGLSDQLNAFLNNGAPPVLFTYGTFVKNAKPFFKASFEIANQIGCRALFATFYPELLPKELPNNMMHINYVPFDLLLPHVAALIHHGGIGTIAQGLANSVPQLVIPHGFDQFDNAFHLEQLGCGLTLQFKHYRAQGGEKINELLTSNVIQSVCKQYAAKVNFHKALDETCDLIEAIVNLKR